MKVKLLLFWVSLVFGSWEELKEREYKFVVVILKVETQLLCLGALVSSTSVLTVCKCVKDYEENLGRYPTRKLKLVAGSKSQYPKVPGYQVRVAHGIRLQYNCSDEFSQVALIKPNLPFVYNPWVQPMPTAYVYHKDPVVRHQRNTNVWMKLITLVTRQSECTVVGFGSSNYTMKLKNIHVPIRSVLRKRKVNFIRFPDCHYQVKKCCGIFNRDLAIEKGKMCTSTRAPFCVGDEGAPIICDGQVFALLTNTFYCGTKLDPPLFEDLFYDIKFWEPAFLSQANSIKVSLIIVLSVINL